jgi:hypothetical protein
MIISLLVGGLGLLVWLSFLISGMINGIKGFSVLLDKFIEVNQDYYKAQANLIKKEKDILDILTQETSDLNNQRKILNNYESIAKNLSEINKLFKENLKNFKESVDNIIIIDDIANNLSTVSNNFKILDKIILTLKKSTDIIEGEANAHK